MKDWDKYKKKAKDIFNNKYTIIFSILAITVFILGLFNLGGLGRSVTFLSQLFYGFSAGNLFFLGIMFIVSSVLAHFKKFKFVFLPILIWLLFITVSIRISNISELTNVATGEYTLGPDLDPFLFLRNAVELSEGIFNKMDTFRYAPLGGTPSYITFNLMPWMIFGVYKILSLFTKTSVTYAAIIAPVIFFTISVIGFFIFSKVISSFRFSKEKSWIIAIIATTFYVLVPEMLHRTVAGIPELESLGVAFFWFAFLFFSLSWKEENRKKQIIFGILSGIFTGAMSWSWGGYKYIYLAIFLTTFLIFLVEKERGKTKIIFSSWFLTAILIETLKRGNFIDAVTSLTDTGLAFFLFVLIWIDYLLFESPIKNRIKKLEKIKIPNSVKSLIILVVISLIGGLIVNPSKIIEIGGMLIERLLYPFGRGRVGLTVSENQVPYLTEVIGTFGSLFWIFFVSSIVIFYKAINHFSKKKKLILFFSFFLFFCAFTFSRISGTSLILNGEHWLSKILYLGGLIIFAITFLGIFLISNKNKNEKTIKDFKEINFSDLLLVSLVVLMIVSMRGAVRLFFIVSPFLGLISAFLPVQIYEIWKNSKDSLIKLVSITSLIILIFVMITTVASYSATLTYNAKSAVPSSYTNQWQYAMEWVKENTPIGSIFVHWWDYGYWVQTLGERPTVTDGGHYLGYWDHLTARYLLTEKNPDAALSLMKSYNVSYLLIDSTDLGKYGAFSKIGGDENYDTFSSIPIGIIDKSQTKETQNTTLTVYALSGIVDQDIRYKKEGEEIFIPGPTYDEYGEVSIKAYVIGLILIKDETGGFDVPYVVIYYNGKQIHLPVRYLYYNNEIFDFGEGIESIIQLIPYMSTADSKLSFESTGTAIYLSPKVSSSLFAQLYLLNDPDNKYPTVNLVHSEQNELMKELEKYYDGEFVYYGGSLQGPIKIWEVDYPENIIVHEEFLMTSGEYAGLDNLDFVK